MAGISSVSFRVCCSAFFIVAWIALAANAISMSNTILVFARDTASSYSATSGFSGYGIPYQLVLVPQSGITLPTLNASSTQGNYGGFVVLSEVSYDYSGSWRSALTAAQWQELYNYQNTFGARMVRLDVYPGPDFGTTTAIAGAGCCNAGVEQLVSISNATSFLSANLKVGATISTQGLWHYPATITETVNTTEVAQFSPGGSFTTKTTAAVINKFGRRQQMVWFTSWATEWSPTSNFLQHAYIHWLTRGLFVGHRRLYISTQIDDVHLPTELYQPAGTAFRVRPGDLEAHVSWTRDIHSRMPSGSNYFIELAHNGNGDIEAAIQAEASATTKICSPSEAIEYDEQIDTALEFQKTLGTGTDIWPTSPTTYSWSLACAKLDPLASWIMTPRNRDAFAHVSHTYTHAALNNATYSDVSKEISFNIAWARQVSISAGSRYSGKGLIPPAITGLHNGDAIRAWMNNGITSVVGDNTRPVLMDKQNEFWPLISNVASNGYSGLLIIPRWATTIYYNCDLPECTTQEWINTSGGSGDFNALLNNARVTNTRHLLALHNDPFMFHQANLRQTDVPNFAVGPKSGKLSLLMIWTEAIVQEMARLTAWPVITLKHDDIATLFSNRMSRDKCQPNLSYTLSNDATSIVGVTVGSSGNACSVPIPVTFPGPATTTASGTTSDKVGNDPLTIWTNLRGSSVSFQLRTPVSI